MKYKFNFFIYKNVSIFRSAEKMVLGGTLIVLFSIAGLSDVKAQFRKYSNEYLNIGVGARAHGMGGAVSASTKNIYAAFWNPAGLPHTNSPFQVSAMHAEWFSGVVNYDFLGVAKEFNADQKSYGGLSIIRMGVDNIPNTIDLVDPDGSINYDNITSFSVADYAGFLTYARLLGNSNWSIGGNTKIIHRRLGPFAKAWGVGIDLGIRYRSENLTLSATGKDVTSTYNAWSFSFTEKERQVLQQTDNDIPKKSVELTAPTLVLGAAWEKDFSDKTGILVGLDLEMTFDGERNTLLHSSFVNVDPRLGVEFNYTDLLYLRAGISNIQRLKDDFDPESQKLHLQPAFGIGLTLGPLVVDYALTNVGDLTGNSFSHIFSVIFNIERKQ